MKVSLLRSMLTKHYEFYQLNLACTRAMNNIAIIGTGWLGLPLAQRLLSLNEAVCATRTTAQRLVELEQLNIPCFTLSLDSQNGESSPAFVKELTNRRINTVIGCFPPRFRHGEGEAYADRWKTLVSGCKQAGVEKILMVSSTTVYPNSNINMDEDKASLLLAQNNTLFSDSARTMLRAEQALIDSNIEYVILRYSGLFGPQRHPARFINKISSLSTVAPVNMLHLEDAINSVVFSLNSVHNQILNVTCPMTVSKYEFYKQAALGYDPELILPMLNNTSAKKIVSEKLVKAGFRFQYENVLDGLNHCN